ncbi:hypothetical protein Egran_00160 [Elaphomyces granulatus]|uniref:Spindle pole body-associated protein cut12 domain-containing protein n=1 Tax=Elaphomyces granulatus TaxID=519963 RepID=A0A232M6W1_9EURO|nr:hypothetical protein Egran_00160 [Elaphomyces granulatus]
MLEWITRQNAEVASAAATDSTVLEPPETPAPVFALRAFRSALFGTPGAEDEEEDDQTPGQKRQTDSQHQPSVLSQPTGEQPPNGRAGKSGDVQMALQAMPSPTKSILVTPGTTSNRRKTVSFGDTVLDNERRKDGSLAKGGRMPPASNFPSQWLTGLPEGKIRVRSKFTESLLDARETSPYDPPRVTEPVRSDRKLLKHAEEFAVRIRHPEEMDNHVILNESRSQSGHYWKVEFDSYRKRTSREIRKLVQYRSAAKSYARKKDEEALRLADKLKEEEAKVADMERHVSSLASTMVGGDADKEKLVQELTKQTTLALQYKHKASTLRRALERHGVIGPPDDQLDVDLAADQSADKPPKSQQALEVALTKSDELKPQTTELKKLQDLAQSSERKASDLEKENKSLKQNMARYKQEMTKYEDRRKEKEAKLKQREAKLEVRNQEYRERLKTATRERREAEEALKQSFYEERRRMQEQIDLLRSKIASMERVSRTGKREESIHRSRKRHPVVHMYDFGRHSGHYDLNQAADFHHHTNLNPQSRRWHLYRSPVVVSASPDQTTVKAGTMDPDSYEEEPIIWLDNSPPKPSRHRSHTIPSSSVATVLPSLPPSKDFSTKTTSRNGKSTERDLALLSPRPTMVMLPAKVDDGPKHRFHRSRQHKPPASVSSEHLSLEPQTGVESDFEAPLSHSRANMARIKRDAMSPERVAAAKARLKQRAKGRRNSEDVKENIMIFDE